jgi:hypothetical protein
VSEPAPWRCPSCLTWLAPHVSEHRCDPPESGVTVTPFAPGPAGSTGTSISMASLPGTITVNVSGSAVSEADLIDAIRKGLLRNWHSGPVLPGRAA